MKYILTRLLARLLGKYNNYQSDYIKVRTVKWRGSTYVVSFKVLKEYTCDDLISYGYTNAESSRVCTTSDSILM